MYIGENCWWHIITSIYKAYNISRTESVSDVSEKAFHFCAKFGTGSTELPVIRSQFRLVSIKYYLYSWPSKLWNLVFSDVVGVNRLCVELRRSRLCCWRWSEGNHCFSQALRSREIHKCIWRWFVGLCIKQFVTVADFFNSNLMVISLLK